MQKKTPSRSSRGGRAAAVKRTPATKAKANNDTKETAEEENQTNVPTSPECDGEISKETPKKAARVKKTKRTPVKKTPAKKAPVKKSPATDERPQTVEDGVADAAQQENGTPKPKRKYVKKQPVQEVVPPDPPPCEEKEASEEEIQPGGRRRRGAAKA